MIRESVRVAIVLAILIAGCEGDNPLEPPLGELFEVRTTSDHRFEPARVDIGVGDRVRWINAQNATHTTTSGTGSEDPAQGDLWDKVLAPGGTTPETFERTFSASGTFPYFCRIHEDMGMTGTVVVAP